MKASRGGSRVGGAAGQRADTSRKLRKNPTHEGEGCDKWISWFSTSIAESNAEPWKRPDINSEGTKLLGMNSTQLS